MRDPIAQKGSDVSKRGERSWTANPATMFAVAVALALGEQTVSAQLSSYATRATDVVGATGSAAVALGVPDYAFVNDAGLGFGGTNTDVFGVGETAELAFPVPLRNHPAQPDLVISAFVGGLGATDNANVQVAASSDGSRFAVVHTFNTDEARSYPPPNHWENDFAAVKHFFVEFGAAQDVTHIRLTNLAGTSEGLRLDSVEGLHPVVDADHAFEVRIERVREPVAQRFKIRIKNIGDPTGVPIREWTMDRTGSAGRLEETTWPLHGIGGDFICVANCVPDNHPTFIPFSRHVWSLDGANPAPAGQGLDPGRQAAHARYADFDTDGGVAYLSGFRFTVTFADGFAHTFDYDAEVAKRIGSLYQKYLYFSRTPAQSWNRPVDYYQFVHVSGSITSFGSGCVGTAGTPLHTATGMPEIGQVLDYRLSSIPTSAAVVMNVGFSNQRWGGFQLPLDLGLIGAPGCDLLTDPAVSFGRIAASGLASVPLSIGTSTSLIGVRWHSQWAIVDPGANAANLIVSNGLTTTLGGQR